MFLACKFKVNRQVISYPTQMNRFVFHGFRFIIRPVSFSLSAVPDEDNRCNNEDRKSDPGQVKTESKLNIRSSRMSGRQIAFLVLHRLTQNFSAD